MINKIKITPDTCVLVLTGAGVSAESGIPTFRGMDGMWRTYRVEDVASPEGFISHPEAVWEFYSERRAKALTCKPNPGHYALAELEGKIGNRFFLATQNVDGFHTDAGSRRVAELHGNIFKSRCSRCGDGNPFQDKTVYPAGKVPVCKDCNGHVRPHIVWFGEMLDPTDTMAVAQFITSTKGRPMVFVAVGTSGNVYPAAGYASTAKRIGATTYLVNVDKASNMDAYDHFIQGKSGEILPNLFKVA